MIKMASVRKHSNGKDHGKTYYAVESPSVMKALREFRNSKVIETHTTNTNKNKKDDSKNG